MSTELSNGVIIPEEYSDDWYDEMSINLRKLNDVITAASDNATDIQRLDTDKANQSDLTALTSRVSQNETDIIALQTAVSGALKREIVQTLPTEDISTTTIYMIRNSESSGTNIYDEYMYINSQWELIGTSATDFSNYYTKNETDNLLSGKVDNSTLGSYYTKTESDNLLSAKANQTDLTSLSGRVTQNETDITALQTAVSGALKREIVQSLPTQDISTTTIYMIRNTTISGDNIYDEYMYINNLWELIGTSATDFSNYYTKTEIDTLLSGKANDSDVVHKSGNETVGGIKSFSDNISAKKIISNVAQLQINAKSSADSVAVIAGANASEGGGIWIYGKDSANGSNCRLQIYNTSQSRYERVDLVGSQFLPTPSGELDCGSNSNKWKSFNGLEPSSLSLPSGNASDQIDISSYFSNTGSGNANSYTAPANGWVYLQVTACKTLTAYIQTAIASLYSDYRERSSDGQIRIMLPIQKNNVFTSIWTTSSTVSITRAVFIPCQGNV